MQIEFAVELLDMDYEVLTQQGLINSVWTHYPALDWLDDLECDNEYWAEEFLVTYTVKVICRYTITPEIYTALLLQWPEIFNTRVKYEKVTIID